MSKKKQKQTVTEEVTTESTENVEVSENDETTASVEPVQLQVSDLQNLGRCINIAAKRGAYEAGEMETIGSVYNKLNAFLAYVASQQEAASEAESSTTDTEQTNPTTATTDTQDTE